MGKRMQWVKITPLPSNVPRQLAIDLLHSHEEVIKLNPLVTGVQAIETPRDSPTDEFYSSWYEISEVITWGFGMKKKIKFKGVFHDIDHGLQSHVYAPMGVDMRNKYRIGGNQPGEPRETRELGVDTPQDGLYLREDVDITCNIAIASYVKKEAKDATGKMIDRLTRKAELLDKGDLVAMFEKGRLKTSKPTGFSEGDGSNPTSSPPGSPSPSMMSGFQSPQLDKRGYGNYHDVARSASQHRTSQYLPAYQQQGYNGPEYARPGAELSANNSPNMPMINELPGQYQFTPQQPQGLYPEPLKPHGQSFRAELAGDSSFSTGPGSTGTPSPRPSPRQPVVDAKPPVQYQAYPPPQQTHPAERGSIGAVSGGSRTPEGQRAQSYSSQGGVAAWQQNVASTSQLSVGRDGSTGDSSSYYQQSRPASNIVPDHQRFSGLSIQQTPRQEPARPISNQQAGISANAKCPVCGLFEGDEAAVSHHVSKAHFT